MNPYSGDPDQGANLPIESLKKQSKTQLPISYQEFGTEFTAGQPYRNSLPIPGTCLK